MTDQAVRRLERAVARLAERTSGQARTGRTHDDADESVGTVDTDDAIGFNPFPLLRALSEHEVPVVVIGQVAGIMHGSDELTGDLDMLWSGDQRHAPALAAGLSSAGAELTGEDGVALACEPAAFHRPKVLFRCPQAAGDCCTPALPWGDIPVAEFIDRCEVAMAGGDGSNGTDGSHSFDIRYLNLADLIAMRRAVGRDKDLRRAAELERLSSV